MFHFSQYLKKSYISKAYKGSCVEYRVNCKICIEIFCHTILIHHQISANLYWQMLLYRVQKYFNIVLVLQDE